METTAKYTVSNLSIGSAHPADLVNLTSDNNGLQGIDWHMHHCGFKPCFDGIAPQPFSLIASIMDTRGVMTMETDQEQWNYGYERYQYDQAVQFNGGKPIANYVVTLRPYGWSWDSTQWARNSPDQPLEDMKALPGLLLSKDAASDGRAVYHFIPASAHPTSSWTPYQQKPDFAWGDYINVNAGITLDMLGYLYLENYVPPTMATAGFTGAAWKSHIIVMFNQERGNRTVYINMTGEGKDTVGYVKLAMITMLVDGMKVDRFIVANFSGNPYRGSFVEDFKEIASHFFYLRDRYPL